LNFFNSAELLTAVATDKAGVWVLVGADSGTTARIRRSTNNAQSWSLITSPITGTVFASVATDYMGTWIAVGASGAGIRSTDNGATWSSISTALAYSTNNINDVFYAGGVWIVTGNSGGTKRSTNGGVSWSQVRISNFQKVFSVGNGFWFNYQTGGGPLQSSSDNGLTWAESVNPSVIPGIPVPAAVNNYGNFVVASGYGSAGREAVAMSFDGGLSWPGICALNNNNQTGGDRFGIGVFSNRQIIVAGKISMSVSPVPSSVGLPAIPGLGNLNYYIKAR
jgi:photosystem II stability/assembly factor-like uncharacterized protein